MQLFKAHKPLVFFSAILSGKNGKSFAFFYLRN